MCIIQLSVTNQFAAALYIEIDMCQMLCVVYSAPPHVRNQFSFQYFCDVNNFLDDSFLTITSDICCKNDVLCKTATTKTTHYQRQKQNMNAPHRIHDHCGVVICPFSISCLYQVRSSMFIICSR